MKKIVAVMLAILISLLYLFRFSAINSDYPKHRQISFKMTERASYAGSDSLSTLREIGDVDIQVKELEILEYDDLRKIAPSYSDPLLETKQASAVRAILVHVAIRNNLDEQTIVPVYDYRLQSSSWHNGIQQDLFFEINNRDSLLLELSSKEQADLVLVYLMYDFQFYSNSDWVSMQTTQYDLVLMVYPDKYFIRLERLQ
ncbi:MAG: hypothetical protein LBS98_06385 [Coriobacteriales bacterium]|nr:hypothetical protein [Coriobacteriales bacterium]